jgi:hypothetical protein
LQDYCRSVAGIGSTETLGVAGTVTIVDAGVTLIIDLDEEAALSSLVGVDEGIRHREAGIGEKELRHGMSFCRTLVLPPYFGLAVAFHSVLLP